MKYPCGFGHVINDRQTLSTPTKAQIAVVSLEGLSTPKATERARFGKANAKHPWTSHRYMKKDVTPSFIIIIIINLSLSLSPFERTAEPLPPARLCLPKFRLQNENTGSRFLSSFYSSQWKNKERTHHHAMEAVREKLQGAELSEAATKAFLHNYGKLEGGESGLIPEHDIEAVSTLPSLVELQQSGDDGDGVGDGDGSATTRELLSKTIVLKLNGGLGTSMGLEKAKSLLKVKAGRTFLDLIADQISSLSSGVQFVLMNSFSTHEDTIEALRQSRPEIANQEDLVLIQSKSPKIDATTMEPVSHPKNPDLEWCPPGHGDIYPSLLGTGMLDRLLDKGFKYAFVSNSDNLGAVLSTDLLGHFASSGSAFMMEVAERTEADKKGGHLCRRKEDNQLILRESAMCPEEDKSKFQDVSTHRYFNTNNLWLDLAQLKHKMDECGGMLPLPLIKNKKTVDPRDR